MSNINRKDVKRDEEGNLIQNVQSSNFIQSPNNNSDITQSLVELYYTDLDTSDDAELFIKPSDAAIKAQNMLHKFPNYIVKFFMFYYEPKEYGDDGNPISYRRRLCQVVPGEQDPDNSHYRIVKRKSLKSIYDKVDFIMIYRPKNTIKWYTVSKEDLQTELAVICEFYGLTNFPDKVGDFYFSKKIGKWLATKELNDIIAKDYDGEIEKIPVFYPDEETDSAIPTQYKTWAEILMDWVDGLWEGTAQVLENIFAPIKSVSEALWEDITGLFQDEDGDWIPDTLEKLFTGDTNLISTLSEKTKQTSQDVENTIEKLKEDLGIKSEEDSTDLIGLQIDNFQQTLYNMISNMRGQGSWWTKWWDNISDGWKNILHKLGID